MHERPVCWLGLRAPALYKDNDWNVAKKKHDKLELATYRRGVVSPKDNRALAACAELAGDVLIVESEDDDIVPRPVILNYRGAFEKARSLTCRVLEGADHGLSKPEFQKAYNTALVGWAGELVTGKPKLQRGSPPA